MTGRPHNLCTILTILVLTLAVFAAGANTMLFAETYAVPQTTEVTLAWDPNDIAPDGYRIFQRIEGQSYDYSQPVWQGTSTSATIYNLEYDVNYHFVARAYVGTDESADSQEVSFMAPSSSTASFTISASINGDGSISPGGTLTVDEGTDQSFTITPGSGSYISDVWVDGVSIGTVPTYTFSQVSQNHIIRADFEYYPHTISASAGAGGSISPAGSVIVDHDSSQGYAIIPDAGYQVADVLVDGMSVGSISSYTFDQVVEDHTIQATFIGEMITLTASAGTNGTITPSGSVNVSMGGSQTFSINPDSGYKISDVVVDGVSMGVIDAYTFSNISAGHTIHASFTADNQAPIANAGPDQTVDEGQTVTLSGLNSIDLDDGIAAFQWRQIQGDIVTLNAPDEPETAFTTPNVDTSGMALVFELSVTDYSGATRVDSCIVNVTWVNEPPIADSGLDQTVSEGSQVLLDASNSLDSDDGIASYAWKQINGSVVTLSDVGSATPSFIAPDVESTGETLTFEVTVTDTGGLQDTATCLINVTWVNTPPVADAGLDQNTATGNDVFLDGSKSYDADDIAITSYRWYQTSGVPVELSDATAVDPMFMVPDNAEDGGPLIFELTVTDSGGLIGKDSCQINVQRIASTLQISSIRLEFKIMGRNVEANAYVKIVDDAGSPVAGTSVTGNWTYDGKQVNAATAMTGDDGTAVLCSDKIKAKSGAVFAVDITQVVKDGYSFDPASNTITQGSLIVP